MPGAYHNIQVTSKCIRSVVVLLGMMMTFAVLAGCGYKFAGSAGNRLDPNQKLWVAFIANDTISPTAQTVVRRALLEEAHAMRGLIPASSLASADLLVSGKIKSYGSSISSYTAVDLIREYRLIINVELEIRRKEGGTPLWKGNIQTYQDFPSNTNLALQRNAEEEALVAASKKLAQKFLTSVEQSY
jgi:outer membrane lipopolysaccharide assembly protein LptE/RlpB